MKKILFVALLLGFSSIVNGNYKDEIKTFDELGEAFDIREFHNEVLGRGAVPLSVLDANIKTGSGQRKRND